jgi:hypothetical protein
LSFNRYYLLLALAFLLLAAAYLGYRRHQQQLFSSVWAFIPPSAVLVLESAHPADDLREWQASRPGVALRTLPYVQQLLARLDALEKAFPEVTPWLRTNRVAASLHVTAPDDFDYLFYLPLPAGPDRDLFTEVTGHFAKRRGYRTDSRNFGGFLIREITHTPSGTRFSYILHREVVVGSYSSFLVEDVVRTLNGTSALKPNPWIALQAQYPAGDDGLHVYLSGAGLPRLAGVFASAVLDAEMRGLAHFTHSARLTAKPAPDGFFLAGESKFSGQKETADYLATFRGQSPKASGVFHLVPTRTATFRRWAFGDAPGWTRRLAGYWTQHEPQTPVLRQALARQYGVGLDGFLGLLGHELVLLTPENADRPDEKVLLVEAARPRDFVALLDRLADAVDRRAGTPSYREQAKQVPIRQLALAEFPAALLGDAFRGFSGCFYAPAGNYVLLASSLPALRQHLADVQAGSTWKNAPPRALVTGQFDEGAVYAQYVDVARAWPLLLQSTSPHWARLLGRNAALLQGFDWLLWQAREVKLEGFSVNARLHYGADPNPAQARNQYLVTYQSSADTTLRTPPAVVRSHVDRSLEVLVQDAANRLYLLGNNGKVLWRKWLEKPVTGEVHQVDYLKNNKLQYVFTTERNLYLLDRNGNPVGNFPVRVPAPAPLQTAAVFDYDNTLDYRFLAQDLVGNLFLYDKNGKLLEGWNPLRLGYRLAGPVRHLRIRDKDYLIAPQLDGKVHALNRKGKPYDGFPLVLSQSTNPLYVEQGTSAASTYLTALSNDGEIVRFNLAGEITERQQLYRPGKNTRFRLCIDRARTASWLIVRLDDQTLSVLDRKGETLFTRETEPGGKYQVQYYDFGAGLRLVALADLDQDQLQLFDLTGNRVGDRELPTDFAAPLFYSDRSNRLLVYTGKGRQVQATAVKVR